MSRRRDRPPTRAPARRDARSRPDAGPAVATAHVELNIQGQPLRLSLEVPAGPARRRTLLPIFQRLADAVVDIAVQQAGSEGQRVSCRKGCGACCRQLVPVTEPEAHMLRELVSGLPAEQRSAVEARCADARRRLHDAGMLDALLEPQSAPAADLRALGLRYFRLGIACPFLENEACSIHRHRPIACREYLVTSPAAHCADPAPDTVRMVRLGGSVSAAVSRTGAAAGGAARWVPLVVAAEWAAAHEEEPPQPGTALLEDFFRQLGGEQ